jgi:hypothetical protein
MLQLRAVSLAIVLCLVIPYSSCSIVGVRSFLALLVSCDMSLVCDGSATFRECMLGIHFSSFGGDHFICLSRLYRDLT